MLYENIVSIFMLVLGISGTFYCQTFTKPAAKYMPMVGFCIMILLSMVVLVKNGIAYRQKVLTGAHSNIALTTEERIQRKKQRQLTLLKVAIIIAFFLSFKYIYYFISMPIVIVVIALLSGISWKKALPTAAIVTAVIYGVFIAWLNVYIK